MKKFVIPGSILFLLIFVFFLGDELFFTFQQPLPFFETWLNKMYLGGIMVGALLLQSLTFTALIISIAFFLVRLAEKTSRILRQRH